MTEIQRLIAQHPELDADELAAAYDAMDFDEPDRPRAYDKDERAAHDIVLAYLQHIGTADWDGRDGERSDRSQAALIQKAGVVTVQSLSGAQADEGDPQGDEDGRPAVLLPVGVLYNLLADLVLLANRKAHADGEGNAQDLFLRVTQNRLAEDAARKAWLASHGSDEA